MEPSPAFPNDDYTVGVITALPLELTAVRACLDEAHARPQFQDSSDSNVYRLGQIGAHKVVLACLPSGVYGTTSAAVVATQMLSSFPSIKIGLMVGIGGGAPSRHHDIRMGDVVVSHPAGRFNGVVQYDLGKQTNTGFEMTGSLNKPPPSLLNAVSSLKSDTMMGQDEISSHLAAIVTRYPLLKEDFSHQGVEFDVLYSQSDVHISGDSCDGCNFPPVRRPHRSHTRPQVHYGTIASGNSLMRDASTRDELSTKHEILCFEMEAAGMMDNFPCLVIRGICDYSDSHKNKRWQKYAAAVAAAYAKSLLMLLAGIDVSRTATAQQLIERLDQSQASSVMASHAMELRRTQQRQDQEIKALARLKSSMYESHKARNPGRVENTCKWFLQHASYHSWRDTKSDALLWVSADPGCGKSVLTSSLIDIELAPNEQLTTCYFFFKDDIDEQQSVATALCAILHQLFQQRPALLSREANHILLEPEQFLRDIKGLWQFLRRVMQHSLAGHVMCILDGLDEGPESEISTLIELLSNFQQELPASPSSADMSTKSLKFLVTSRPYFSIKSQFQEAVDRFPAIHLSREDESATIEEEIGLVIQSRTEVLTRRLRLSHNVSHALLRKLLEIPNRTYLWLHLMFNVLQSSTDRTERKLTIALETIPETVDQAYEKILERSTSREDATKILHVMLAARRPLTIHEINTILALKKGSTSYTDLDLEAAEHISETIRNICGLFVTIRGSEVYLFHMTARNFLLRQIDNTSHLPAPSKSFRWRQSFEIDHSNLIIAEACVDLLLLDEFYQQWVPGILHKSMIEFRPSKPQKSPDILHPIFELLDSFAFGSYSARYWAFHFLAASQVERKVIHDRVLRLCESQRLCCSLWFPLYQRSSIPDLRLQYSDPTLSDGQWQSLKNLLPPATRLAFITSLGSLELVQDYIIAARTKGKEIFRFDSLLGSAFMVSVMWVMQTL